MMDYTKLVPAVRDDPYQRGYTGMTDQQVADSLSVVRTRGKVYRTLTAQEFLNALGQDKIAAYVQAAEDESPSAAAKRVQATALQEWLYQVGSIDMTPGSTPRATLEQLVSLGVWTNGIVATLDALAQVDRLASDASELGLGTVGDGHVYSARKMIGGAT